MLSRHTVDTVVPGFGCTIADAVKASCSAYPFLKKTTVKAGEGSEIALIDGGNCANNPKLYAIADAVIALKRERSTVPSGERAYFSAIIASARLALWSRSCAEK